MASWARLAAAPAPSPEPVKPAFAKDKSVAVVDANAIITLGLGVRGLADVLYTTEGALDEIRDSKSRQVVEQLEFVTGHPSEESLAAVTAFAKLTGDLHQLSREDVRLLALAHTLEVELHGSDHLRKEPVPIRRSTKVAPRGRLPGWGNNGQSDEWDAIDALQDSDDDSEDSNDDATEATDEAGTSRATSSIDVAAGESGNGEEEDDGAGWQVAKRSSNAARRAVRKAKRKNEQEALRALAEHDEEMEEDEGGHDAGEDEHDGQEEGHQEEAQQQVEEGGEHGVEGNDEHSNAETRSVAATDAFQSNVSLVTADFPMQNVCLQMGLRLVSKNGLRITSLQRFVLRCVGCSTVCQDTSKLFCPACGHATLARVEVTVDVDGANVYGVRKKHVLKGTRYSLPKPTGGRNQPTPILSEDVYKAKVRKPKQKATEDDPFADGATFGDLKKFQGQPDHIAKGLSHLTSNFRNNPNERKATMRSNRRKR